MSRPERYREKGLKLAIERCGVSRIAKAVGLSRQAVSRWESVPEKYMKTVQEVTGYSKSALTSR